jgi:hypothetical protein
VSKAGSKGRSSRQLPFVAVLGVFLSATTVHGQNKVPPAARRTVTEYEVKAAFLLNFAKFVEWPPVEESRAKSPFSICIFGDDPFGKALDQIVEGEFIDNRPLVVQRLRRSPEHCEVVFVSASERNIPTILNQVGSGVLTVGESPDFLSDGGIINFVIDGRRVRFDISRGAAERASLRISSRLLGVARSVLK